MESAWVRVLKVLGKFGGKGLGMRAWKVLGKFEGVWAWKVRGKFEGMWAWKGRGKFGCGVNKRMAG